jgi:hypothetical protein
MSLATLSNPRPAPTTRVRPRVAAKPWAWRLDLRSYRAALPRPGDRPADVSLVQRFLDFSA